jgi:hypothetical protein
VIIISPSLFSIFEYIEITPFEIELIRKIDVIENIRLIYIKVVFRGLAFKAFSDILNTYFLFYFRK